MSWRIEDKDKNRTMELSYAAPQEHEVRVIAPEGYRLDVHFTELII
ncbi:hypothetical protein [Paenibacillus sp. 1P07SE]